MQNLNANEGCGAANSDESRASFQDGFGRDLSSWDEDHMDLLELCFTKSGSRCLTFLGGDTCA